MLKKLPFNHCYMSDLEFWHCKSDRWGWKQRNKQIANNITFTTTTTTTTVAATYLYDK